MGFPSVHVYNGSMEADLNTKRFSGQYSLAQKYLDSQVITDSTPYVPYQSDDLRRSAIKGTDPGSGEVIWDSPYARYQYYGRVMVGPPPKQVTDTLLQYATPGTGAYWFETAKGNCKKQWIDGVRKIAGGG